MTLKHKILALLIVLSVSTFAKKKCPMEKQGWKLAVQTWSFNRFTFIEAIDKLEAMGIKYIEAYPGQTIGGGIEGNTHFSMPKETQKRILKELKKRGITLVNYGVISPKDETEWNKLFEFAKNMGIETIVTEPAFEMLDLVEKLSLKYKINVAIHNHATPTRYWDPNVVLRNIKNRNNLMGACCDNGHWMRSGLTPTEGYETLKDRIKSLHFKDMNDFDNLKAHTVPFGTGKNDVKATLLKLKELKFKGVITIEYEYHWENPDKDIKQSIDYFKKLATDIL